MSDASALLEMNINTFSLRELAGRAAMLKGITLQDTHGLLQSEPLREYILGNDELKKLAKHRIVKHDRPDENCQTISLVDENPQVYVPAQIPDNTWDFGRHTVDIGLRVSLHIQMSILPFPHGVVLTPVMIGGFKSAGNALSNFRMFKALAGDDLFAPDIAKALAASDGSIMVTWIELGLPGLKKLSDVFTAFKDANRAAMRLHNNELVFTPSPTLRDPEDRTELFVTQEIHAKVMHSWWKQLTNYAYKRV